MCYDLGQGAAPLYTKILGYAHLQYGLGYTGVSTNDWPQFCGRGGPRKKVGGGKYPKEAG